MEEGILEFKGRREGLFAVAKGFKDFESFLEEIENRISQAGDFFKGACLAGVHGIYLDEVQEEILRQTVENKHHMKMRTPLIKGREKALKHFDGLREGMTQFLHSTLRSGQKVSYEGNIVIIGDVNPGAEVEAGGNIVVLGALRGVARAGMPSNHDAFIAAVTLQPTQLRIGNIVARWPENYQASPGPEIAYIENGKMYIKPSFIKR